MTHATDLIPAPLRILWQDAMDVVAFVLDQFDRAALRAGIRRDSGVRLTLMIRDAESALRRLILMAALALTPAPLKPQRQRKPTPRIAKPPHASFRVFSLHGAGAPHASRSTSRSSWQAAREPEPYGHIRFPADPILALGRMPTRRPNHRHNGGPVLPRPALRHPLARWGRLSRNDPDWRPPEPSHADIFDYNIIHPPRPKRKRKPPPETRYDSTADWRRCYDEWQKLVPAPTLAARLDALERLSANPGALIRRTARRLQPNRDRTLALARAAWPNTTIPRHAKRIPITGHEHNNAIAVHAALDTS